MQRPGAVPRVVRLEGAFEALLEQLPKASGVVQLLGERDRPLMTARPSNVRRWVSNKLGVSRSLPPGRRPRADLREVTRGVRYAETHGGFEQRLACERWLAEAMPAHERREPRPAWLQLDTEARFPRVAVCAEVPERGRVFGPFRDRAAAERALKPLHRLFPLRPCEYVFEPAAELPLGLSCFFAQVRTCAAPCLLRVSGPEYRALAEQAAAFLGDPAKRPHEAQEWLPEHCREARGRALVVEVLDDRIDLFPVLDGAVLDPEALRAAPAQLEQALGELRWTASADPPDDRVWLAAWLHDARRRGHWLSVAEGETPHALATRVRVVP